jgi:hypothetical protein
MNTEPVTVGGSAVAADPPHFRHTEDPRHGRAVSAVAMGLAAVRAVRTVSMHRERRWRPPSGVIEGNTLRVRRLGSRGTPIILLHGLCGSSRYWAPTSTH